MHGAPENPAGLLLRLLVDQVVTYHLGLAPQQREEHRHLLGVVPLDQVQWPDLTQRRRSRGHRRARRRRPPATRTCAAHSVRRPGACAEPRGREWGRREACIAAGRRAVGHATSGRAGRLPHAADARAGALDPLDVGVQCRPRMVRPKLLVHLVVQRPEHRPHVRVAEPLVRVG
eukprot:scaffold4107_cov95-Isochrysis_galbana.AAC.4